MFPGKNLITRIAGVMAASYLTVACAAAQDIKVAAPAPDPQIVAALKEISASQIQRNITTLVGFSTRQTLSSELPPTADHGVNAAAFWIQGEFERYSSQCGDCLQVKTDQFIQQPAARIPEATTITNVYAILRGTDPVS